MSARVRRDPVSGERVEEVMTRAGLAVRNVPRRGFRHAAAVLSVGYGSNDATYVPRGAQRPVRVPDGLAHFLEHKMFEKERGDVMTEFAVLGAEANAMTGHVATSFTVSGTTQFDRALRLLLEVVFDGYFTDELVAKELGIIEQEIRGYDDHPGWRAHRAILENLFRRHPVRRDIAGTVESIRKINAGHLSRCHEAFYVPSNMVLAVAGDIAVRDVVALVDAHLGTMPVRRAAARRVAIEEPETVKTRTRQFSMPVSMSRLYLGFKGPVGRMKGSRAFHWELAALMFLEAVLGETGPVHESLFAEGLIGEDFTWSATCEGGVTYVVLGGETPHPRALEQRLLQALGVGISDGIPRNVLGRIQRRMLGDFVRSFDSLEVCCWNVVESFFRSMDLFGFPALVARTGAPRLRRMAARLFDAERLTRVVVKSRG